MMSFDFQTTTHGKWILAGEHAVVRGRSALVFPVKDMQLTLSYSQSSSPLVLDCGGDLASDLEASVMSGIRQACHLCGYAFEKLTGRLHIKNSIPLGVGLGASAALCVAITRWFVAMDLLDVEQAYFFAKNLEDLFHGKSSGLDIAGVSAENGVYFLQHQIEDLELAWTPRWYLSSCLKVGKTADCIKQVQSLWTSVPEEALAIDEQMEESVSEARQALTSNTERSSDKLAEAMRKSCECFRRWGLVSDALDEHIKNLIQAGAKAVKPTGSGGGGYVVSLWEGDLPQALASELIAI